MDEVEALSKAIEMANSRWSAALPNIWWDLEGGEWRVTFDSDLMVRFRQSDGTLIDETKDLDPVAAFRLAKSYALREGQNWTPAFALVRVPGEWHVGARQSQLGGQLNVVVRDDGSVRSMVANPK